MKAAFYRTYGGPEVLEYGEIDDPTPGPEDVVVAVAAVGLNRRSPNARTRIRMGQIPRRNAAE